MSTIYTDWNSVETDLRRFFEDSFVLDGDGVFRDVTGQEVPRNKIRKIMYKHYTFLAHGNHGKGCRVKIPECVLVGIREMCPDENGSYMGFKEK